MILQISDDESIVLTNLIWANYERDRCETVDLHLHLENGHLYIVLNDGGVLKVRSYKHFQGKLLKEARKDVIKRKPREYEGICIDLNLQEEPDKENKEAKK